MPFIRSVIAGSVLAIFLATPAAALDLDVGGIADVSVGGNGGGLDVGVGVNVGGKGGIQADSNTSVGGGSLFGEGGGPLVDSNTSATIGGSNGVKASNSTTVGGKNGVLDSSTRASAGGINAGVDANVGTRPDANADLSSGGNRSKTSRGPMNSGKPNDLGNRSTPGNPGPPNNPGNKPNSRNLGAPGKPNCLGGSVSGLCGSIVGSSSDLRSLAARMPDTQFIHNMRKCRGILADPNRYERPLIELCKLLLTVAR